MLLRIGSSGDDVKELQERLGLTADGKFGPGTEAAVKKWQEANGLAVDGVVSPDTWGELSALRVGSSGEEVKDLQEKLGITADGKFGPGTEKAVKEWQQKNGLTADGVVRPDTWNKLFSSDQGDDDVDAPAAPAPTPAVPAPVVSGLKLDKLKGKIPDAVISQIAECATKFEINTPLRLAHFLAQCGHESAGFKVTQENLKYSADGLRKIFRKYFPGNLADSYAKQPEKIASRVYANRMGNGDEASKEGYKYRGRGYIQLTGKDNYTAFSKTVSDNVLNDPDLVSKKYPLLSAAWFWNSRSLNKSADKGATDAVVTEITKKVNGGTIGLADRIKHFKEYYALLK